SRRSLSRVLSKSSRVAARAYLVCTRSCFLLSKRLGFCRRRCSRLSGLRQTAAVKAILYESSMPEIPSPPRPTPPPPVPPPEPLPPNPTATLRERPSVILSEAEPSRKIPFNYLLASLRDSSTSLGMTATKKSFPGRKQEA